MQLNLRTLDLNLLPIFAALMREQHLSRAAENLAMSQPAASSALKRLRLCFNDELFVRTAHGLVPTARALQLQQAIQPALQLIQSGCSNFEFDPKVSDHVLSLSMNAATEYLISASLYSHLHAHAPKIKLQLQPDYLDDIPAQLKAGRLDFALDYVGTEDNQYKFQVIAEEDLVIICRRDHPQIKSSISLTKFSTLAQASLIPRSNRTHKQSELRGTPLEQLMGKSLPKRNVVLHASSFVALPSIIASSNLIAIVPRSIAIHYNEANHGTLKYLAIPFDYPMVQMKLLWHKSRDNDPAHRWFKREITNFAQQRL